jgi:hypothetical protein
MLRKERVAELEDMHQRLVEIVETRSVAYGDDPVGRTGCCARRFKIQGSREYPVIVEEYTFDRCLFRQLLKIQKHLAIELGQRGKGSVKADQEAQSRIVMEALNAGRLRPAREAEAAEERARQAEVKAQPEGAVQTPAPSPPEPVRGA